MKKQLFLLLILCIGLSSCEKGGDNNTEAKDNIIGTWYVTEMSINNKWQPVTGTCAEGMNAQFSEDLVYKSLIRCNLEPNYTGTYTYENNVAVCKVKDAVLYYHISELTGNKAVIDSTQDDEVLKLKAVRR